MEVWVVGWGVGGRENISIPKWGITEIKLRTTGVGQPFSIFTLKTLNFCSSILRCWEKILMTTP